MKSYKKEVSFIHYDKEIRPLLDGGEKVEFCREERKGSILMTDSIALDWV